MAIVMTRDQQPLYVRTIGTGQPVLMLPGLGMTSRQWLAFIVPYIGKFRFYMPDFRGFGQSAAIRFNQPDVFENHAQDVQDIIHQFNLEHLYLVGYSLGASTALHLQSKPEFARVQRYLHIEQSPCVGNRADWSYGLFGAQQPQLFQAFEQLVDVIAPYDGGLRLQQLPRTVRRAAVDSLGEIFEQMTSKPIIRHLFNWSAHWSLLMPHVIPLTRLEDIRLYLRAYMRGEHDYRLHLGQWQIPTTVFIGMQSPLYQACGQRVIAEKMQPSRVVEFNHSGHTPLLDEPVKFLREFGQFLNN